MIDAKGLDLSETTETQTLTGLYDDIIRALGTGKPIFYTNVNYDGDDCCPFTAATFDVGSDGVVILYGTLSIAVSKLSVATITDLIPEEEEVVGG